MMLTTIAFQVSTILKLNFLKSTLVDMIKELKSSKRDCKKLKKMKKLRNRKSSKSLSSKSRCPKQWRKQLVELKTKLLWKLMTRCLTSKPSLEKFYNLLAKLFLHSSSINQQFRKLFMKTIHLKRSLATKLKDLSR